MSYQIRSDGPGLLHHITARVNWREWHLEDVCAKQCLAQLIREAAEEFGVDVLAAVLMSNHMHLVIRSAPAPLYRHLTTRRMPNRHYLRWPKGHQKSTVIAQFMRSVRQRMSLRRQKELNLSGRFWEGRYNAKPIEDATSLTIRIAYDHRNPVKQGMVVQPEDFRWSTAETWRTGAITPLPVLIRQPLPFGLTYETLRCDVLRYQDEEALDLMGGDLETLWSRPGPIPSEHWADLFRSHGMTP